MSVPTPEAPRKKALRVRRLPRLVALIAVCATLAVFVLPLAARELIGPQRLKSITEQTLSDALGRRVTITGEVSILFVPWFGLAMGPVTVAEAPGFGEAPMLAARRVEMTIRVLPLLRRVVSPGSVRVRDLTLHLRRDASGRTNWQDLTAPVTTAAADAPGWEVTPEPRDIRVENATLTYDDAVTGRSLAVRQGNLNTGRNQPFHFSTSFTATGFVPDGQMECHATGLATFDAATGTLGLEKTVVETALTLERPLAPGGATPTRVLSRLVADYAPATGILRLSDLDARLAGARLTGTANLTGLSGKTGDPRLETHLRLVLEAQGKWREILGLTPGTSSGNLVAASGPQPGDTPPQPGGPDARIEPRTSENEPGKLVLSLDATADAAGLRLDEALLTLPGQGRITARARLGFGRGPALDATLDATDVDFDTLPRPAGSASWSWPAPWPGYWPEKGTLDARIDLRHCRLAGLAMTDAHATVNGGQGLLRLYPVSILLPGGLVAADARIDAGPAGSTPETPTSLGLDARAVVTPTPTKGEATVPPSRVRLLGRLHADGGRGNIFFDTPDPARAAAVLGLAGLVPLGTPLEAKGTVTVSPGVGRPVAKAALTGLEARIAGTVLRGQVTYDTDAAGQLGFDLAADTLDLDRLGTLSGAGAANAGGSPASAMRAEGKLRVQRLEAKGIEAQNVAAGLTVAGGKVEGTLTGGELFGGRLSGKVETTPAGRVSASLVLTGAEAARLPGLGQTAALAGAVTAKAAVEAQRTAKGKLAGLTATVEAESPSLHLGTGNNRQTLRAPKAQLTLKGRDAPTTAGDMLDCDAALVVTQAAAFGLTDIRLAVSGLLALDGSGQLRDPGPVKVEASALARPREGARPVRLTLAGPVTPESSGTFSTGELRLDAGGLPATVKLWRKGGEGTPVNFSLETGALNPRKALADWGMTVPAAVPADRLAKGACTLAGTATGQGLEVKKLALTLDDGIMTGNGVMTGYNPLTGKWNLSLDRLDWDAYFPHQAATGPPPLAERRKPLDLAVLRKLALDARISLGWFKKGNVTFGPTTITAASRGGQFTYRQDCPRFYGGRFAADIKGDARDTALKTLVELKLESIEIARFLWDWAEGNSLDSGGATFILAARTSGDSELELRDNLAGNASLQITRGTLKVREPASTKPGATPTYERIPFDVFSSSWLARGGVAHTEDFLIESPRMHVSGRGNVDLRDESINLSITAALPSGSQVPATIIGPLDGPKLTIDRSKILGDMAYRVLQGIVSIPGKAVTRILQIR